jgi:hypothetical protein
MYHWHSLEDSLTNAEDSLTNAELDSSELGNSGSLVQPVQPIQPETLAQRLSQGALPLGYVLRYATDVASSLRDLHEEGRLHGSVNADSVVVTETGARLLPPNGHARYTVAGADVSAFGALLYEMVTGAEPSPRATPPLPPITSRNTPKGLEAAATRLASKCLRSTSNSFTEMQKVLTEVRLLGLQSRNQPTPAAAEPLRAPAAWAWRGEAPTVAPTVPAQPAPGPQRPHVASLLFTPIPPEGFMPVKDARKVDLPPSEINCPICGVRYVYPSRPNTWFEALLGAWGMPTLRCRRCLHRYIVIFGRFQFSKGSAANRGFSL